MPRNPAVDWSNKAQAARSRYGQGVALRDLPNMHAASVRELCAEIERLKRMVISLQSVTLNQISQDWIGQ